MVLTPHDPDGINQGPEVGKQLPDGAAVQGKRVETKDDIDWALERDRWLAEVGRLFEVYAGTHFPEDHARVLGSIQSPKNHAEGPDLKHHLAYILYQYDRLTKRGLSTESPSFEGAIKGLSIAEVEKYVVAHDFEKEDYKTYKFEGNPAMEKEVVGEQLTLKSIDKIKVKEDKEKERQMKKDARKQRQEKIDAWLTTEGIDAKDPHALEAAGITIQNIGHERLSDETLQKLAITSQEKVRLYLHMRKGQQQYKSLTDGYCEMVGKIPAQLNAADVEELKRLYALSVLDAMGSRSTIEPKNPADFGADFDGFMSHVEGIIAQAAQETSQPAIVETPPALRKFGGMLRNKDLMAALSKDAAELKRQGQSDVEDMKRTLASIGVLPEHIDAVATAILS